MNKLETKQTETTLSTEVSPTYWFALKVFYNKVFEIQDALQQTGIESYVPSEEVVLIRHGVKKTVRKPLVSGLLFFRATFRQSLDLQQTFQGKVILYTRMKEYKRLPMVIPERQMNLFMLVTSSGKQGLEYLGEDHPKYHRGERVRVIDGPFQGAEGHICRIKKNNCLVVTVEGVCAVATSYIPRCFLEKVEENPLA